MIFTLAEQIAARVIVASTLQARRRDSEPHAGRRVGASAARIPQPGDVVSCGSRTSGTAREPHGVIAPNN